LRRLNSTARARLFERGRDRVPHLVENLRCGAVFESFDLAEVYFEGRMHVGFRLNEHERLTLRYAAVIGRQFDAEQLSQVSERCRDHIVSTLRHARQWIDVSKQVFQIGNGATALGDGRPLPAPSVSAAQRT
jgi:hypothetical protein